MIRLLLSSSLASLALVASPCVASDVATPAKTDCTAFQEPTLPNGKAVWGGVAPDECINPVTKAVSLSESVRGEWPSFFKELLPMGARLTAMLPDPDDPQLREELYRYLYSQMAAAYISRLYEDPDYPDFWPYASIIFNAGVPSPDHAYYLTHLDGKGVYRLSGRRGTVHIVDAQIGAGTSATKGTGPFGATLANYDFDKLHIKADGTFEVLLSTERPANYTGDWWKLDPRATHMWVRQISNDWLHEVDASLAIERLDVPAVKPRMSAQEIDARLHQIPAWVENWTRRTLYVNKHLHDLGLVNKVQAQEYTASTGKAGQAYIEGLFDLAPDEALVLETEIPKKCRFWNFQLTDELWSTVDWMNRQSSLNDFTAKRDGDGKLRLVISAQDPGVPNWLDNMGLKKGMIYGRWTDCETYPVPTVRKIKVADVRKYLPSDTPSISLAERDAAIRIRREGAQLRRRW